VNYTDEFNLYCKRRLITLFLFARCEKTLDIDSMWLTKFL